MNTRYFTCEPRHGVFSRLYRLTREPIEGAEEILNQCRRWALYLSEGQSGGRSVIIESWQFLQRFSTSAEGEAWRALYSPRPPVGGAGSAIIENLDCFFEDTSHLVSVQNLTSVQKDSGAGGWIFRRRVGGGRGEGWIDQLWGRTGCLNDLPHSSPPFGNALDQLESILTIVDIIILCTPTTPYSTLDPSGHSGPQTLNATIWNWHHR